MNHIGLFEGIGGFSLAASWVGWETIAWCEIDKFCQTVLKYHFPNAKGHGDIKETDFTIYRGECDIVTGGFPCQPFSVSGQRKGTEDDRHLWPEMLRAIREIQPEWVVGENVYGIVNWSGGLVFEQVQADMENEGYEVWAVILPACSKNAPHKRDRVWFIAHSKINSSINGIGDDRQKPQAIQEKRSDESIPVTDSNVGCRPKHRLSTRRKVLENGTVGDGATPDAINTRLQRDELGKTYGGRNRKGAHRPATQQIEIPAWDKWPTQPPVCWGNDGFPGSLDSISFSRWRNESIKAYGNAIVPQIALEIFKAIDLINSSQPGNTKTKADFEKPE
jgi:DNA (cytosine-5)-methyltransferase 1